MITVCSPDLETKVNEKLAKGYSLCGGVAYDIVLMVKLKHQILTATDLTEMFGRLLVWQSDGWRASGGICFDGNAYHLLLVKET